MSGTFMDGGGHDHGGHAVHGGHDCVVDGGVDHGHMHHGEHFGADGPLQGGHEHFGHSQGGFLASLLGLNQQQHHSFLAHLLGLDNDAHHTHAGSGTGSAFGNPHVSTTAQIPFWSAALQSLTFSNIFQGVRISPACWMLIMFLGYISWLAAVSWIRHHEPVANAIIGTGSHPANSIHQRRSMTMPVAIPSAVCANNFGQVHGAGSASAASIAAPSGVSGSSRFGTPMQMGVYISAPQPASVPTYTYAANPAAAQAVEINAAVPAPSVSNSRAFAPAATMTPYSAAPRLRTVVTR